jgi:hypothetical protein
MDESSERDIPSWVRAGKVRAAVQARYAGKKEGASRTAAIKAPTQTGMGGKERLRAPGTCLRPPYSVDARTHEGRRAGGQEVSRWAIATGKYWLT